MQNKRAIITLTRGWVGENGRWQDNLIALRNQSIDVNLKDKCDFIIFHEGNLSEEQQRYIRSNSLIVSPIKFVNVPDYKSVDDNIRKRMMDRRVYESGYASMCNFWFCSFMNYLTEYDYVIRIDDDCIVDTNIDSVFEELKSYYMVSPMIGSETHRIGLIEFINGFLKNNNIESNEIEMGDSFDGPYTNYCGFNLIKLRNNPLIMKYIDEVNKSGNVYMKNWQDVSLWGSVMKLFLKEDEYKELTNVSYYHLSHLKYVNGKRFKKSLEV